MQGLGSAKRLTSASLCPLRNDFLPRIDLVLVGNVGDELELSFETLKL